MLNGLNHITLSVSDLSRSFLFYSDLLSFHPKAKWATGAYLTLGSLWLCLTLDENTRAHKLSEYTHIAFDIEAKDFVAFSRKLLNSGVEQWKDNSSEGDSLYFLDPDGHKLEIHVGNIESRLHAIQLQPYQGLVLYPQ